ncbi:uncharacterized protein LOC134688503 [Mytilus trossulus]|uniref:uncharacterized protein LOC134688503 n=1 Tax=Mytilus trossulus TaxID=6551 RepID=UPI003007F207
MPSSPTDQGADTSFDKHLSLREKHTDQATLPNGFETNVENCTIYDDFKFQVVDERIERMNESFQNETHPNKPSRLSTNSNSSINQVEPSFDKIVGAIHKSESIGNFLAKNGSPACHTYRSDKAISTNCSGSNPIHIASVHKSEEDVDNVVTNKHIEREEKQNEVKSDETNELLEKGTNKNNRPYRRTSTTCTKLVVMAVIIAIICLGLVIAVIVLFIRIKALEGHRKEHILGENTLGERSNDFKSLTLHVNWSNIKTVTKQNVNLTWCPVEQNKFIDVKRDIINIIHNGTYELYLSLNIDIPRLRGNAPNESLRYISLICLKTNRYENQCQRQRSPTNTACTVSIKTVFPLLEGDKIWVSVMGINHIYKSKANNRLVITKYT